MKNDLNVNRYYSLSVVYLKHNNALDIGRAKSVGAYLGWEKKTWIEI